jgi:hypothetical protein
VFDRVIGLDEVLFCGRDPLELILPAAAITASPITLIASRSFIAR